MESVISRRRQVQDALCWIPFRSPHHCIRGDEKRCVGPADFRDCLVLETLERCPRSWDAAATRGMS